MKYNWIAVIVLLCHTVQAQNNDSLLLQRAQFNLSKSEIRIGKLPNKPVYLRAKYISFPAAMVAFGFVSLELDALQNANKEVREEILEHNDKFHTSIDNYLQFAPAASVYLLNASGIKGKHNFKDRTILLGMSTLLMAGTVFSIKKITHQLRPDGSAYNSFPSGHTAAAFSGAEFMAQEYRGHSPFLRFSGYAMSTGTGVLRMYNNKHWLTDVITGAGIGILSTKASYWLFEKMKKKNSRAIPAF